MKLKLSGLYDSFKVKFNTEAKLPFAYTGKNMTDNATGKIWMSNLNESTTFLKRRTQLWDHIIAKWPKPIMTH